MRFNRGLRILLTNPWYNYSFLLAMISTGIISSWILTLGELTPNISDPIQGLAISIVISFQYFVIVLVVLSLVPKGRELFFEGSTQLRNQIILSIVLVVVFMAMGPLSAIAGPVVGAALAFGDGLITAYFAVLLGWNIGKTVSTKIGQNAKLNWMLFVLFWVIDFMVFGAAYMFLGLGVLPIEQQIIMLMFPLGVGVLPILTVVFRDKSEAPSQTTIMTFVLFILGIYYTVRLASIADPQFTLVDMLIQAVLLIYGLSTTVAKVHENPSLQPLMAITILLLVILARVGSQVNRLLAASTGLGNIVQAGITSLTILNLAILGLLIPVYWMWKKKTESTE